VRYLRALVIACVAVTIPVAANAAGNCAAGQKQFEIRYNGKLAFSPDIVCAANQNAAKAKAQPGQPVKEVRPYRG
jgi:hypothetical protein